MLKKLLLFTILASNISLHALETQNTPNEKIFTRYKDHSPDAVGLADMALLFGLSFGSLSLGWYFQKGHFTTNLAKRAAITSSAMTLTNYIISNYGLTKIITDEVKLTPHAISTLNFIFNWDQIKRITFFHKHELIQIQLNDESRHNIYFSEGSSPENLTIEDIFKLIHNYAINHNKTIIFDEKVIVETPGPILCNNVSVHVN